MEATTSKLRNVLHFSARNWTFLRNIARCSQAENTRQESQKQPSSGPPKSWKEIPGPSSLPFLGQLLHFLPGRQLGTLVNMQEELYKAFGPIVRLDATLGRPAHVLLYDPEACAQILRGENWLPIRPGFESLYHYRKKHRKVGYQPELTGLVTDHGENWRKFRSAVNPVMMQPKIIKLYSSALDGVAEDMVARMKTLRDDNNMLKTEFDTEMNLWALESIGVVALGRRLNCFDPNLAEDSREKRLIRCVHEIFTVANKLDFQPNLWRYFPTRTFKRAMELYQEQEELARYFVTKSLEELKTTNRPDSEKGVLEKLMEIDEEIALIMVQDMLFGGVDTAANTMISTLYLLAKNQEKQNKLRQELRTKTPEESSKYLKACIKESMRIQPVVSGNMRATTKEYDIMGYRIPKGMYVVFSHQYLSVMESQFPRPLEYIPERWLDKDSPLYYKNAHPFSFSPFGFGVRMCIGRRIAELELETFLSKVIRSFKVEWVGPAPRIEPVNLNYVRGPFRFILTDA